MTWTGEERRSDISIAIRRHEKREQKQHNELAGAVASLTNDMNQNHKALSGKMDEMAAWKDKHEVGDKIEHDKFFAELGELKEPVIELKKAIDGLGAVGTGLFFIAKIVGSVSIILGGAYAVVHFGGKP